MASVGTKSKTSCKDRQSGERQRKTKLPENATWDAEARFSRGGVPSTLMTLGSDDSGLHHWSVTEAGTDGTFLSAIGATSGPWLPLHSFLYNHNVFLVPFGGIEHGYSQEIYTRRSLQGKEHTTTIAQSILKEWHALRTAQHGGRPGTFTCTYTILGVMPDSISRA